MGLIVYNENKTNLSSVAFLKDTFSQEKIRNIDGYEFTKQIGILLSKIKVQMGIKHEISDIYKTDIKEMILSRFKNLSLNEVEFAFKLERYGEYKDKNGLESRTEHFHDFNTVYCSTVLGKYVDWKRKTKSTHNIHQKEGSMTMNEKEKQYWINKGVTSCLEYFEEHRFIEQGKVFVYEILYDDGYLPTDPEFKRKMYADAQEVMRLEYSDKKAKSRQEKIEIKNIISEIESKKNGKVITRAKELVLNKFFRDLTNDPKRLSEFKTKYAQ